MQTRRTHRVKASQASRDGLRPAASAAIEARVSIRGRIKSIELSWEDAPGDADADATDWAAT